VTVNNTAAQLKAVVGIYFNSDKTIHTQITKIEKARKRRG
jgi:hypothetical protein